MKPLAIFKLVILSLLATLLTTIVSNAQSRRLVPLGTRGKRLALVIGNDAYKTLPALFNAARDARDVSSALTAVGFRVMVLTNANREVLDEGVDKFIATIEPGDVALFFYSGHAVQIGADNYLSPIDLYATNSIQARDRSLKASEVLEEMEARGADLQIMILDACRDNPFVRERSIGAERGLAVMSAGRGTFLAYATAPGQTADDNALGSNGLYTTYLIQALKQPGLSLEGVFKEVNGLVRRASGGKQVPWVSSSLDGDFYFRAPSDLVNASAPSTIAQPPKPPEPASNEPTGTVRTISGTYVRQPTATFRVKALAGDFALWIDPSRWVVDKTENGKQTFKSASGNAYGLILAEQIGVPPESAKNLVLSNIQSAGAKPEIAAEEWRRVNGREVLHLKMTATIQGIPFLYHYYLYGGSSGTLQALAYTIKGVTSSASDSDLLDFLNGLEMTDTPLPPPATLPSLPIPTSGPLTFNSGKFTLMYDQNKWHSEHSNDGRTMLSLNDGGGYAMVIPEELEIPFDAVPRIALANAQKQDANARVVLQEKREVSGHEVWCLKIDSDSSPIGVPVRLYGYYYSGKQGTLQLMTYTTATLFDSYETEFTSLLNSLVIAE